MVWAKLIKIEETYEKVSYFYGNQHIQEGKLEFNKNTNEYIKIIPNEKILSDVDHILFIAGVAKIRRINKSLNRDKSLPDKIEVITGH